MIRDRLKKLTRYHYFKKLYARNERLLIPGMLVVGVVIDFVTFQTIQVKTALLLLTIYLVISGATIAFINFYDAGLIKNKKAVRYLNLAAPLIVQFTFGALLSASLIFYWFSGSVSISWPFILIIALLMVSNDALRHYYLRPVVQIGVYYFILFSIFSVIFPFVLSSISPWVFMLSGVASLVVMYLYVLLLSKSLDHIHWQKSQFRNYVLGIFLVMNALYFLNIIPPIPLAIREAGVYHSVVRVGTDYIVQAEESSFFDRLWPGETSHRQVGERVYVFTSIFAPAQLNTRIFHHWQYFDEDKRSWVSRDRLSFSISGGRQDGYRGYSLKSAVEPGKWRVDVETARGQVLGRVHFTIENVDEKPNLVEIIK